MIDLTGTISIDVDTANTCHDIYSRMMAAEAQRQAQEEFDREMNELLEQMYQEWQASHDECEDFADCDAAYYGRL